MKIRLVSVFAWTFTVVPSLTCCFCPSIMWQGEEGFIHISLSIGLFVAPTSRKRNTKSSLTSLSRVRFNKKKNTFQPTSPCHTIEPCSELLAPPSYDFDIISVTMPLECNYSGQNICISPPSSSQQFQRLLQFYFTSLWALVLSNLISCRQPPQCPELPLQWDSFRVSPATPLGDSPLVGLEPHSFFLNGNCFLWHYGFFLTKPTRRPIIKISKQIMLGFNFLY